MDHGLVLPETYRLVQAGPVDLINVSPPAGAVVEPAVPEYAVHLLLDTTPLMRVGFNRPPRWLAVTPGAMLLAPPDTPCEYVADAPAHVLTVAIPKACVDDFTDGTGSQIDIRQEEVLRDPALAQQLVRLWHAAADEAAASSLVLLNARDASGCRTRRCGVCATTSRAGLATTWMCRRWRRSQG